VLQLPSPQYGLDVQSEHQPSSPVLQLPSPQYGLDVQSEHQPSSPVLQLPSPQYPQLQSLLHVSHDSLLPHEPSPHTSH
jgi:hypothetical protein